eukprot:TRINITY_DN9639_c0_g1_i1.p1 TRINITY_DN9639_c0_g1~~TRINITY_DN9639_c0_g1_i1.p1  ORF type:complete len:507 (+),score=39.38 TRINITY_DN9639_c0_g1_i1:27-1547(+)
MPTPSRCLSSQCCRQVAAVAAVVLVVEHGWLAEARDSNARLLSDIERYNCEARGLICAGDPVDEIWLDRVGVASPIYGGDGKICLRRGLVECMSPRARLRSPKPVIYPSDPRFEDRYFTLRRLPHRPSGGGRSSSSSSGSAGDATGEEFAYCLFFRRNWANDRFNYVTCEVCSRSSLAFNGELRCIDPVSEKWGATAFRHTLHHNIAVLAPRPGENGSRGRLFAFGGQVPGIWRLVAPITSAPATSQPPSPHNWQLAAAEVEITRFHPGCVDLMSGWNGVCVWTKLLRTCRYPQCGCEFDGRLSVVHFKQRLLLYARANIKPEGGGRFVQVSSGAVSGRAWGPFNLITIMEYDAWQGDIYTFSVHLNPQDPNMLLSLFPVIDRSTGRSSIAMSLSEDGIWWSPMVDLLSSLVSHTSAGRTMDHPVDGIIVSECGREVYFFVQHTVPGIGTAEFQTDRPRGLLRYTMRAETLQQLAMDAKGHLAAVRKRHPQLEEAVESQIDLQRKH